jgi:hypothetical protein
MNSKILLLQLTLLALCSCQGESKQEGSAANTTDETPAANTPATSTPSAVASQPVSPPQNVTEATTATPAVVHPDITPALTIKTLWCNEVTDALPIVGRRINDEDEVFFLVGGKKSDGTSYQERFPEKLTWSLTKSGGPGVQSLEAKYGPYTMPLQPTLKDGESVEMTIVWMEADDAQADERLAAAAQIARETAPNDQRIGTAANIVEALAGALRNKDDLLGALAVRITNDKGTLKTEWQAKEHCTDVGSTANGQRFNFENAGGAYMTTLEVK